MPTLSRPVEPDAPYNGGWESYAGHKGIDYGWRTADPVRTQRVYAALGGRVSSVYRDGGNNNDWGNRVIIDHGYGIQTTYSHLRTGDVYVNVGDQVSTGHHLARMGTTGRSTGVHLHFELYIDGDRVDPEPYFTTPLPRIPNTPQPEPEPEDDMYDQNARNELFAELRKLTEEIKRFASPLKLFTYGTGIVAVNPQTGKSMVLSAGYPELLAHLGYAGGGAPVVEQGQLNYATNYVGDAVGIPSLKLSGMSAQTIAEVERTVAENRVSLSQDQYDRIVDEVAAAVRENGVDGVEKALSARTTVIAPVEA